MGSRATTLVFVLAASGLCIAEGTGFLKVTSEPPGVEVHVNGEHRGVTPCTVELGAGTHAILLKKEGFGSSISRVEIRADEVKMLNVTMEKASPSGATEQENVTLKQDTGNVVISSEGRDVEVVWDREPWGETPISRKRVPAGTHIVRAGGLEEKVVLGKGQTLRLRIRKERIVDVDEERRIADEERRIAQEKREADAKQERERQEAEARESLLKRCVGAWEITSDLAAKQEGAHVKGYMQIVASPERVTIYRGVSRNPREYVANIADGGKSIVYRYRYLDAGTQVAYQDRDNRWHVPTYDVDARITVGADGNLELSLRQEDVEYRGKTKDNVIVFRRIDRSALPW